MTVADHHLATLRRYERILEAAGYVLFTTDVNGRFTEISGTVEQLTGYAGHELIGAHFSRLIAPDWAERVEAFYRQQLQENNPETVLEFPIVTRSGEEKWVEQTVILPPDGDHHNQFQAIVHDVTARRQVEEALKRSEARYRAIVEDQTELICRYLPDGTLTFVNEAYCRYFGKTREELIGHSFLPLVPPEDRDKINRYMASLSVENPLGAIEHRVIAPNGEVRWQHWADRLIFDERGNLVEGQAVGRDITERVLAEQEREKNQLLYKALFEQTNDAVFIISLDGVHLAVNQQAAHLLGYTVEELVGMPIKQVIAPREYADSQAVLQALLAGKAVPVYERILRKKSGQEFPVEINATLVRDAEGKPLHIQSVVRDITERKRAERELQESEARYRQLFEGIDDAIFVHDLEANILDVNEAACRRLGYSREELLSMKTTQLESPDYAAGFQLRLARQLSEGGLGKINGVHIAKDGRSIFIDVNSKLIEYHGRPAILAVVRDISDLKQVEEQLNKRIEELTTLRRVDVELADRLNVDYVLSIGLDAAIRLSKADVGFIGVIEEGRLRVAQAVGNYSQEAIDAALSRGEGIIAQVLRQQKAEMVADLRNHPDYRMLIPGMLVKIVIPLISQERVVGVLALETSDLERFTQETVEFLEILTARIAVALDNAWLHAKTETQLAELQALYDRVSGLEQIKTDMIRIASHDLRNPLGTITGYLELLRAELGEHISPAQSGYLDNIEKAARRMQKIVSDILSLERIEEFAQRATLVTFDLREVVAQVFHEQASQAALKSQRYDLECAESALSVFGDPVQVQEAVANLISNAIKYTPDGGAVLVSLQSDGQNAVLAVKDTGYGIPEAQQARLFQPFYRARTKEIRDIEGTGLGLHLVKNIIERYGGRITFHSVYGTGSTFGFSLPLIKNNF